ncbi:hypothetical protein [Streptomyces sp. NPDC052693]|uniref:hypothetical protein n=1 Tax=Streptomyces sp. NPDC052693 TaxID=3155814 RepID=UPI00344779A9
MTTPDRTDRTEHAARTTRTARTVNHWSCGGQHMKRLISRTALGLAATALAVGGLATSAQAAPAVADGGDPTLTDVCIWATDVNLRQEPTTNSARLAARSQW